MKLNDLYSTWAEGDGVFSDLESYDVPWKPEDPEADDTEIINALNYAYHGNHSGDKPVSPIVFKFITAEANDTRERLASTLITLYLDKWKKLWDSVVIGEYNPLNNYDMVENETPAELTHTITPAETTTEIKPAKTITENDVSAFNSSDYEDSTKTVVTGDAQDKGISKLTVDEAGTDILTVQTQKTLTRSGNIGVMSSQSLLTSEIELRKWNYFLSVFKDIDTLLTLSIY